MYIYIYIYIRYLPIDVMFSNASVVSFRAWPRGRQVLKELGIEDPLLQVAQELEKAAPFLLQ